MADFYPSRRSPSPGSGRGGRFDESSRRSPPPRGRDRSPDYMRKRRRDDSPPRGFDRELMPFPDDRYGRGYGPPPDHYDRRGRGPYRDDPYMLDRRGPPPMAKPSELPYMVTFSYFSQFLKATSSEYAHDADWVGDQWRRYKVDMQRKGLTLFFDEMKGKAWFAEKYEPGEEKEQMRKRNKELGRKGRVDGFLQQLQSGDLDQLTFDHAAFKKAVADANSEQKNDDELEKDRSGARDENGNLVPGDEETEVQMDDSRPPGSTDDIVMVPPGENQMFIKSISPDISRVELETVFKDIEGFKYLALSEPHAGKKFHRVGWANFVEGSDMVKIAESLTETKINNFTLHMIRAVVAGYQRLRTAPGITNSAERVEKDLSQTSKLVSILEAENGDTRGSQAIEARAAELRSSASEAAKKRATEAKVVEGTEPDVADGPSTLQNGEGEVEQNVVVDDDKDKDVLKPDLVTEKKILDLYLYYLRYTFHTCYYCLCVCDFSEELERRCAKHVRRSYDPSVNNHVNNGNGNGSGSGKKNEKQQRSGNEVGWVKNMDEKAQCLLAPHQIDAVDFGGERLEDELHRQCKDHVVDEGSGKFRCNKCSKLFKAQNFIEKHIATKHVEVLDQEKLHRIKFLNNYVLDPSHVSPPTQSPPEMNRKSTMSTGSVGVGIGSGGLGGSVMSMGSGGMIPHSMMNGPEFGGPSNHIPFGMGMSTTPYGPGPLHPHQQQQQQPYLMQAPGGLPPQQLPPFATPGVPGGYYFAAPPGMIQPGSMHHPGTFSSGGPYGSPPHMGFHPALMQQHQQGRHMGGGNGMGMGMGMGMPMGMMGMGMGMAGGAGGGGGGGGGQRRRDGGGDVKRARRDGSEGGGGTNGGGTTLMPPVTDPRSKSVLAYNDLDSPADDEITLNY